eukprot:271062-Rhodomonas_salina.2
MAMGMVGSAARRSMPLVSSNYSLKSQRFDLGQLCQNHDGLFVTADRQRPAPVLLVLVLLKRLGTRVPGYVCILPQYRGLPHSGRGYPGTRVRSKVSQFTGIR